MEKIELSTPDITQENIERIAALFPDVVTESLDDDGNVVRAIDFDALRQDLSGDIVDGPRERYQFTWPGKQAAKLEARKPCDKTMRPVREESVNWDETENLYIEGDNLEALKIMRETYAGKVKLIYIDPPYNTGNDFIYDDDFAQTRAEYEAESGEFDEEGGRLVANPESNGRFHSDWCSSLYPRILLARDLLDSDGILYASIDNGELVNLTKICDEIFGAENHIDTIVWNKRVPKNDNKGIGNIHEYILVYAKQAANIEQLTMKKFGIDDVFQFIDELKRKAIPIPQAELELKKFYKERGFDRGITLYNQLDDNYQPWGKINMSWPNANTFGPRYEVIHPNTALPVKIPDRGWRWNKETFERALSSGASYQRYDGSYVCGRIWFAKDENTQPSSITYLRDVSRMLLRSIISLKSDGGIEVEKIFEGKSFFSYPKPVTLMKMLIESVPSNEGIFMDFFSGSGTTADAVLRANAEDGGNRRFVLVQLPEESPIDSEAAKAGYRNICELGQERIRRIAKEIEEDATVDIDCGFRVLRISASNFRETRYEPGAISQSTIFDYVDNLIEGRSVEDLLFQVMPKFRIPYSAKYAIVDINGKTIFNVNNGQLIACFDEDVDETVIEEIAKMRPLYAVFRDASMADDATAANFEELFKTYSPDTIRRVI
ncbi:MAG: site-specific DNA-methyltransferase [Eggerthellaceae bacterium]|nr:site-specific DNA-methyltransferase [Eggerthellaceae bacterium]